MLPGRAYYGDEGQNYHDSAKIVGNCCVDYGHFIASSLPGFSAMGYPPDDVEHQRRSHRHTKLKQQNFPGPCHDELSFR